MQLKELEFNPFGPRLCRIFSEDGSGTLGFEELLDMLSVFSRAAHNDVRLNYLFRMYGTYPMAVRGVVRESCMYVCLSSSH